MKFWDSSAAVPFLVTEPAPVVTEILDTDRRMHVWCEKALARLNMLRDDWSEIAAGPAIRTTARRLLRLHPLRAADSLQLAAAMALADGDPGSITFLSFDDRLRQAARLEGFTLLP